jgi:ABC-type antimicrobial peptide transport system permease subunit
VGAGRRDLLRLVLGEGLWTLCLGLGLGVAVALLGMRWLGALLHGTPANDPLTYGVVGVALLVLGHGACWLPARRAAAQDPAAALSAQA